MYTNKDKVGVVVYVDRWRVEGDMHLLAESRLTDALNSKAKEFIVITDASIYDVTTGELMASTPFVDISRAAVTMIHMSEQS